MRLTEFIAHVEYMRVRDSSWVELETEVPVLEEIRQLKLKLLAYESGDCSK